MIFYLYDGKSIISLIILSKLLFTIYIYYILLILFHSYSFFHNSCNLKIIASQLQTGPWQYTV